MGKNKGKGGKNWKKGKKRDESAATRELIFKEDGQEYATVQRMLGDGRAELYCHDDVTRIGLIRGTMRRRVWINAGDTVLVGLREFQDGKADILHKYSAEEARTLATYGELSTQARVNQTAIDIALDGEGPTEEDTGFNFEDV